MIEITALNKLTKDIKTAAVLLTDGEARYLVDTYYQLQEYRKATDNQCRTLDSTPEGEPHETLIFFADNFRTLENNIKVCLQAYVLSKEIGRWMMSIPGIGPVISAGLLANIDIKKVQTAGQIHAFAGLDPTREWNKGEKRPYNARLKTLCWKIGQSFIKVSNKDDDIYGHVFRLRKDYEVKKNENHEYAEQANLKLATYNIGKNTEAYKFYKDGMLPPAHINQRAARYAVKLFLSHLFTVWYQLEHGEPAPKPYPIGILNHAHEIYPPNWKDGKIDIPENHAL